MSEQLFTPGKKALLLSDFMISLMDGKVSREQVIAIQGKLAGSTPKDFISAVDHLVQQRPVTFEMKKAVNKMLNVFYTYLSTLEQPIPKAGSFFDQMVKDNQEIVRVVGSFKPAIKEIQKADEPPEKLIEKISTTLAELAKVDNHYQVTENVLFSFLEKQWPDHRCLQVLWSVHDDARNEIGELQQMIKEKPWDLKRFNRLTGDLFFDLKTIIFREEKILLPAIVDAGLSVDLDALMPEVGEIGWSFIKSKPQKENAVNQKINMGEGFVNFATGQLSFEQIELIFNHLPVDITFVDENDTVRYFSTPKKRTFTRTNSVIGRKVQNCHPPESVWMVEKILEAFKKGEQDDASFWIPFKDQFVLIQYFAVRDLNANYMGTIEVTQDVKEIRNLKGERRLLNWEKETG